MNITWEFLFTFVYPSVGGIMQEGINASLVRRRHRDPRDLPEVLALRLPEKPSASRTSGPCSSSPSSMVTPMMVATVSVFGRENGSVYTAFIDNLIMSALFLSMLLRRGDRRGQSMWIAWGKLLGTVTAAGLAVPLRPGKRPLAGDLRRDPDPGRALRDSCCRKRPGINAMRWTPQPCRCARMASDDKQRAEDSSCR